MSDEKEIEVVSGDGSELDVSPVFDHLNAMKPKAKDEKDKREIIIPQVKEENNTEN